MLLLIRRARARPLQRCPAACCCCCCHALPPPQLAKSERETKALRAKLKAATTRLDKAAALGARLQELGAGLVADVQLPGGGGGGALADC